MPETNDEIRRRPSDGTWLRLGIVLAVVGPLFALAAFWEPQAGTTRDIDPRNGQAFIQDNLWTAADGQYAVWVDDAANPIVGRRDDSDEWRTVDLGEVAGNPFAAPTVDDDHNVYAIAVDSLGHVHVAGNMHSEPLRYARTATPGELDEWVTPTLGGPNEQVTYPMFVALSDGTLLFFRREGFPARGLILLDRLRPGATDWEHLGPLIDGVSEGESGYLQKIAVDPSTDTIHLAWIWRAGRTWLDNSDISYMRSIDGGNSWTTSVGAPLVLPVTHATAEIVWRPGGAEPPPINSGGMVTDGEGRPHLALRRGGSVLHLHHDGTRWIEAEPLDRFNGRPGLVRVGDGSIWALGTRGSRLRAEQVHPTVGPVVEGPTVSNRFEVTADTQLMQTGGRVQVLLPVRGDDTPTVAELDVP